MEKAGSESTHFIFDGENAFISPDISIIFHFLMGIEKEVDHLLKSQSQLESIHAKLIDLLDDLQAMAKVIEDNKIPFAFKSTHDTLTIVDDFESNQTLRAQMICLFAYLETMFCLITIYDNEIDDEPKIIEQTKNNLDSLISTYILNEKNSYYKANLTRLSKIGTRNFKKLRNLLTHFFSVSDTIGIIPKEASEKAREVEALLASKKHNSIFLSPEDIYGLMREGVRLLFDKWTYDTQKHPEDFKRKIYFVKSIVEKAAPKLVEMQR